MSVIFEMPIDSETLAPEELAEITGCARKSGQIAWLTDKEWIFHKNKAGEAIVGRLYARLRMAGINPSMLSGVWQPDYSGIG